MTQSQQHKTLIPSTLSRIEAAAQKLKDGGRIQSYKAGRSDYDIPDDEILIYILSPDLQALSIKMKVTDARITFFASAVNHETLRLGTVALPETIEETQLTKYLGAIHDLVKDHIPKILEGDPSKEFLQNIKDSMNLPSPGGCEEKPHPEAPFTQHLTC